MKPCIVMQTDFGVGGGGAKIVDRHDIQIFVIKHGTIDQPTDSAKTVKSYFCSHRKAPLIPIIKRCACYKLYFIGGHENNMPHIIIIAEKSFFF